MHFNEVAFFVEILRKGQADFLNMVLNEPAGYYTVSLN
jgi:hypothetical protein